MAHIEWRRTAYQHLNGYVGKDKNVRVFEIDYSVVKTDTPYILRTLLPTAASDTRTWNLKTKEQAKATAEEALIDILRNAGRRRDRRTAVHPHRRPGQPTITHDRRIWCQRKRPHRRLFLRGERPARPEIHGRGDQKPELTTR